MGIIGVGFAFLVMGGCNDRPSSIQFKKVSSVQVDESGTVIINKPRHFRIINDSTGAVVLNREKFVLYDLNTGKIRKKYTVSSNFEDSTYKKLRRHKLEEEEGPIPPSFDSVQKLPNIDGLQLRLMYTNFWYHRPRNTFFLPYALMVPAMFDHRGGVMEMENFLIELNRDLRVVNTYFNAQAWHKNEASGAFKYSFGIQGDSLFLMFNKGELSAPFPAHGFMGIYNVGNGPDAPFVGPAFGFSEERMTQNIRYRSTKLRASHFRQHDGKLFYSDGEALYATENGDKICDWPVENLKKEGVIAFSRSEKYKGMFYNLFLNSDPDREAHQFALKAYVPRDSAVVGKVKVSRATDVFKDKVVSLKRKDEHYYFEIFEPVSG